MDTRAAEPTTVGEMLSKEFLKLMGITQEQLGEAMGLSRKVVGQIINNILRIGVAEAITLSALFETDEDFWITIQAAHDRRESRKILASGTMPAIHQKLAVI